MLPQDTDISLGMTQDRVIYHEVPQISAGMCPAAASAEMLQDSANSAGFG